MRDPLGIDCIKYDRINVPFKINVDEWYTVRSIIFFTRHSIAHTIFKMRRDKRNASLEIAMAEKKRNY